MRAVLCVLLLISLSSIPAQAQVLYSAGVIRTQYEVLNSGLIRYPVVVTNRVGGNYTPVIELHHSATSRIVDVSALTGTVSCADTDYGKRCNVLITQPYTAVLRVTVSSIALPNDCVDVAAPDVRIEDGIVGYSRIPGCNQVYLPIMQ